MTSATRARAGFALLACCALCACARGGTGAVAEAGAGASAMAGAGAGALDPFDPLPIDEPGAPAACGTTAEPGIGARQLRRLARFEYQHSVQDLLGLDAHAEKLVADTVIDGFDTHVQALVVTPLLAQQLYENAERLAAEAVADAATLAPCATTSRDAACAEQIARDLGRRAYRRPLADAELARYRALYTLGSEDGGFDGGLTLVLTALLQSPGFLYRSEIGQPTADGLAQLDGYELATELSYVLTGSSPDTALLDAAERGELVAPEAIEAQAVRLLDTPRGRAQLVRFVQEWLELDRLASVPKDATQYPELTAEVRAAMASEVQRFVEHVAFEGEGTLVSLLESDTMFANQVLAGFYGVALPAALDPGGFGAFTTTEPQRRGLLTLGAVMTTHARPDSSSPVHRGKLVRERVLCQPLAPPPPGIVVQPPPVDPTKSVRERYAAHSAISPCVDCHRLTDPVGFGFEHFDGIGRYRTEDAARPVDASGEIVASRQTDGAFADAAELVAALAGSPEVESCVAQQWFRFAYGLTESEALRCALAKLQGDFGASTGSLRELMLAATRTDHFRFRIAGPELPVDDPGTTTDAGTAGDPGLVDGGVPEPPTGLTVELRTDSSWATGHCDSVKVTNGTSAPLDWSVPITLDGMLNDHWNSEVTGTSGDVVFSGAPHNRTLAPGASADFGYCVAK